MYTDKSLYTLTEALILFEISNKNQCTASYLAEYFLFDKGYISRILNKLEGRGVIKRTLSQHDRRIKYLMITKKGREELKELAKKASEDVAKTIESIEKEDLEVLIFSMQMIEQILGKKK